MKPIASTRILDLTRLLPGAICTMMLHDLGAEIIKIEDPQQGDYARWMPPLIDGMGAFFHSSNRGKKSVILNLKDPAGQAVLHRLAQDADVLIEGFRPGVTARLAADYQTLQAINPRLVYSSLSGWGQSGPLASVSGHDLNYIASNGVLGAEQIPRTPSSQVADVAGSYVAVMGILAALLKRERTGTGDYVDVSLAEAAMPFAMAAWMESILPSAQDSVLSLSGCSACYRVYYAADGKPVVLGAIEGKFWANFCNAMEKPQWIEQHTLPERQPELIEEVAALFETKKAAEWANLLEDADCCFSRVTMPEHLLEEPHWQARGMVGMNQDGLPWMRSPVRLSDDAIDISAAPQYGEHTQAVLQDCGFSAAEIDKLLENGVICQSA